MKLATWNVNSLAVRLPQLLDWLAANPVDAIVLQETKLTDDKFPQAELEAAGYRAQWFGQRTYNGVALLSRSAATDVVKNIPGFDDGQARVIAGTVAGVRVIGGGELYALALPHADELVLTEVDRAFDGADAFFPRVDRATFAEAAREARIAADGTPFAFVTYRRTP